ncbi:hypothetical protein LCGC14_1733860 [marine sediment metagenome]|uniref:DUF1353 domain-containing protein n=1 Tax=marine sediment metagenome TaxID=412755 RepID=A0A0F9H8Q3_9ZZZZ
MSSFTSPLIVKVLGKHKFELFRSFTFHVDSRYSKELIRVPKGFITDFASVPKAFWSIIPPYGKYTKAAVLHDYLYKYHGFVSGNQTISYTRKEADQLFLKAMEVLGVGRIKRWIMYQAVRRFGAKAWNK